MTNIRIPLIQQYVINAPSKSAINVLAPLFNALITILRSVGPVISTLLSSRPGAGGAQVHDGSLRTEVVSAGKSGGWPASKRRCASSRATRRFCLVELKVL